MESELGGSPQHSPRLKAQVERFECDLSVYLVLDDDRVRCEFPIKDRELAVILEKQYGTPATKKAAAGAAMQPASSSSSLRAVAFRAPVRLNDIVDYVRSLSPTESREYFTKEGLREHTGLLNFTDEDSRPHDLAEFLFWDLVANDKEAAEEQNVLRFIKEELQAKVCREAAMAELWIAAVEPHAAPPTPEQWAQICEMCPPAQRLALNVLVGLQVQKYGESLAERFGEDKSDVAGVFKRRVR